MCWQNYSFIHPAGILHPNPCTHIKTHINMPVPGLTVACVRALYSASILASLWLVSSSSSWMFSVCFFCSSNFSCSIPATAACSWRVEKTYQSKTCIFFFNSPCNSMTSLLYFICHSVLHFFKGCFIWSDCIVPGYSRGRHIIQRTRELILLIRSEKNHASNFAYQMLSDPE